MSQVLIGIIGVILFIGLALAGALFLGERFQDARNESVAAASISAVDQVVRAIELYHVNEGHELPWGSTSFQINLVGKSYLKALPDNPTTDSTESRWRPRRNGSNGDFFVTMQLGSSNNEAICEAINRQTSGNPTIPYGPSGTGPTYCFDSGGGTHSILSVVSRG